MSNDVDAETEISIRLPIKRVFPEGHSAKFANHFVILRPSEHEVHFLAFCIRPPIMIPVNREGEVQIQNVEAECVAEIIFPASRLDEVKNLFALQPTVLAKNEMDAVEENSKVVS